MTTNDSDNHVTGKKGSGSPKITSSLEEDRLLVISQMLKRIPLKDDNSWIHSEQMGLEEYGKPRINGCADDSTDSNDSSAAMLESTPPTFAVKSPDIFVSNSKECSTPQANIPSPKFAARRFLVNEQTIPDSQSPNGSPSPVNPMNLSKESTEEVAALKSIMNSSPKVYTDQDRSVLLTFGVDSGELSDIKISKGDDEILQSVEQKNVIVIKKEIHNMMMTNTDQELFQVSGRDCTFCGNALEEIKIIIEHLNIYSHPSCFKCGKCSVPLGGVEAGDNLWIHCKIVHCEACYDKLLEG